MGSFDKSTKEQPFRDYNEYMQYVFHCVNTALFGHNAYKNVITTGTLAGNDGRKMSKSYDNTIPLFAPSNELKKKVMRRTTMVPKQKSRLQMRKS